jgi:hypothetical protein
MAFCQNNSGSAQYPLGERFILRNQGTCCMHTQEGSCQWVDKGTGHDEQRQERENAFPLENVFHPCFPFTNTSNQPDAQVPGPSARAESLWRPNRGCSIRCTDTAPPRSV